MTDKHSNPTGFTLKAFLVGALLSLAIGMGSPYNTMVLRGSHMALDFSTPAAVFLLFLFVATVNVLLGVIRKEAALKPGELTTVYIMMIVATTIPSMGLVQQLLPIIAGVYYYASPENNWADLIHPYVSDRMAVTDMGAIKDFFEGTTRGEGIPWSAWMEPLLYWGAFMLAFYFVMICMMVMLRKQWVERERLIFPIIQVGQEMIRDDERRSLVKPFFRNPVMWFGFILPFGIGCINALHHYYGAVIPSINL